MVESGWRKDKLKFSDLFIVIQSIYNLQVFNLYESSSGKRWIQTTLFPSTALSEVIQGQILFNSFHFHLLCIGWRIIFLKIEIKHFEGTSLKPLDA